MTWSKSVERAVAWPQVCIGGTASESLPPPWLSEVARMVKKSEVVVLPPGFDYPRLEPQVAGQVQATAERIRLILKKTLEDLIAIGSELQAVKEALEHGQFNRWLQAEFGRTERLAQNFMTVAERFGPKSEIISDLQIQPTAAYLLAAPSVPDEARQPEILGESP